MGFSGLRAASAGGARCRLGRFEPKRSRTRQAACTSVPPTCRRNGHRSTTPSPRPADGFPQSFSYNSIRIPLYIAWAGLGQRELYAPFRRRSGRRTAAWRDADRRCEKSGKPTDWLTEKGYTAIAALTACAAEWHALLARGAERPFQRKLLCRDPQPARSRRRPHEICVMLRQLTAAGLAVSLLATTAVLADGGVLSKPRMSMTTRCVIMPRSARRIVSTAEIRRLSHLDPTWRVPASDLYSARRGRPDEGALWALYSAGQA